MSHPDDIHMAIWQAEQAVPEHEARWLMWIEEVEKLLGHDADGDQSTDGYSMDGFYDMFKTGMSAVSAVESLRVERGY